MTERLTLSRMHAPWRAVLAAAALAVVLGWALVQLLSAASVATPAGGAPHEGLSSLPAAAQGAVSSAIGAADRAYRVSSSGGGYRAVNPRQRLSERFQASGVLLSSGRAQLGISLRSLDYGGTLMVLSAVSPRAHGNRVEYTHRGLSEWYANGPLGLEQGFTLPRAPAGRVGQTLTLAMALAGAGVHAALAADGKSVILSRPGAAPLRYGALLASDARGRTLRSRLGVSGGELLLRVDTRGASYPLRIDPLVQQGEKLKAGESAEGARFGFSVALSADGNTALVGDPGFNAGLAWVFTRTGSTWTQQGEPLIGGDPKTEGAKECGEETGEEAGETGQCGFGRSVALSADGNTALVGGPRDHQSAGAAWVFSRSGSEWTQQGPKLTGFEEGGEGRFGRSVSLSGDGNMALIGGSQDTAGHGAAWVFTRSGSQWSPQGSKLTGGERQGESHFGASVKLSSDGETALVGGPGDDGFHGAAWVFVRSGSNWAQQGAKLTATGHGELGEGHFGASVALSGDGGTALVGARDDHSFAGAAWVLTRTGSTWAVQGGKLEVGEENGEFGYSVALSGDGNTALIGGPRDNSYVGGAWLFTRSESTWTQQGKKLEANDEAGKGWFGASVALSSDAHTSLVGGPNDAGKVGAAWPFQEGPIPQPVVTKVAPKKGPAAGGTTVSIGGINFGEATAVSFGSTAALTFTVNSPTSITATSPLGIGAVDVTVTTLGGESAASANDLFSYVSPAPMVAKVAPQQGPAEGGSTVTITGENLAAASAVDFGSTSAASFKVDSPTSITAVTATESPGQVDVRVTTPGGTSAPSTSDRYAFVPSGVTSKPPEEHPPVTTTPHTLPPGNGGVLGFGPIEVAASCRVSLLAKRIAVQSHGRAVLRLAGNGPGTCRGSLTLKVRSKISKKRFKMRSIGTATFTIPAGKTAVIRVKLNGAGRALLKAGHGRLNASLLILKLTPLPAQAQTPSVRLTQQKSRKPRTPRK